MLTDTAVRNAKGREKPYKLADERGLFLLVNPSGSKLWRLKYRVGGREKLLAFGAYPDVSLSQAREQRESARKLLAAGGDPSEAKQEEKRSRSASTENTFEAVARRWHATKKHEFVPKYAETVLRSLEADVFPHIGSKPIADIRPPEVLSMLRRIEARGALETLKRVRQRCSDIFLYAIAEGLREAENPVSGIHKVLKKQKATYRAALHIRDLPEFFIRLDAVRISLPVKLAIRLNILLFLRPGELRSACWSEIDLDNATWIVPAERDRSRGLVGMKMREAHTVPLSRQAVEIFRQLKEFSGHRELVFPNRNDPTRPISDGTINSALRAMGYSNEEVSGHGFRATAASALAEMSWRREVIDAQLSHRERNEVLGAYTHQAQYLDERRKMMQAWADRIDAVIAGAKVIPFVKVA